MTRKINKREDPRINKRQDPRISKREDPRIDKREGAVALLAAVLLVMLLGFGALAVDIGNMYRVRTESQGAVDAAALAGARELNATAAQMVVAEQQAIAIGNQHYAYATDITMTDSDVDVGNWNSATRTFTTPATSTATTNAVRVRHTEATVARPFAGVLPGVSATVDISATAIALGGGPPRVPCAFPLALGSCTLEAPGGGIACGGCMQMANARQDNIGWSNFNGNTSNPQIADAIRRACYGGVNGTTPVLDGDDNCVSVCGTGVAGTDTMDIGNGNNFTRDPNQFCELIKGVLRASASGTFRAQVPVFDAPSAAGGCNPNFGGPDVTVIGYAQVEFLGARCGNADRDPFIPANFPTNCGLGPGAPNFIITRIECDVREDAPAGGGFFGLAARPVLVD